MAKILVADDNSNIQRMVGLALKDQGIEVVAVGNGEAAVRKISEIHPDLVLADVFMPVRNGYEVCQYVKQNSALAHIPVILLIGAFDPLDEQEAQKVGSDGVLKKPFVPPDPLISMVKSALQKAGVSLSAAGSPKSASSSRKSADAPKTSPADASSEPGRPTSPLAGLKFSRFTPAPPPPEPAETPAPDLQEMSFVEEPAAPAPVTIAPADNVMAFENLLGGTTTEDPRFVASEPQSVSELADEQEESVDVPEDPEPAELAADAPAVPSWRRDESEQQFADDATVGAVKDWRDADLPTAGRRTPFESWEQQENRGTSAQQAAAEVPAELGAFTTELSALETESRTTNSIATFEPEPLPVEPQAQEFTSPVQEFSGNSQIDRQPSANDSSAALLEEPAQPQFVNDPALESDAQTSVAGDEFGRLEEAVIPPKDSVQQTAAAEESRGSVETRGEEQPSYPHPPAQEVAPEEAQLHDVLHELEQAKHQPAADEDRVDEPVEANSTPHSSEKTLEREPVNSWFSRPVSPWDTEPHRTSPLAAAWGNSKPTAVAEPEPQRESESEPVAAAPQPEESATQHPDTPAESHGTNGQSTSHDMEEVAAAEPATHHSPAALAEATQPSSSQPDVDELVARVLAKMNPDVLQAVTREILKPMVAAILAEESKRKE